MTQPITKATIKRLRIQNYRVLRDVQFSDLTPLTVLLGPNGSGKSTVLRWSTSPGSGAPRDILSFRRGEGRLYDDTREISTDEQLDSPDLLAVSTLGGLARHPRVAHLRRFVSGWYLSYLSGGTKRTIPPCLSNCAVRPCASSDRFLHPRLLHVLAEEAGEAADRSQLLVTTHSPYFVDALRPKELWILYRDDEGFTRTVRASDMQRLVAQADAGGLLGNLWMEGYFEVGDPLVRGGRPRTRASA